MRNKVAAGPLENLVLDIYSASILLNVKKSRSYLASKNFESGFSNFMQDSSLFPVTMHGSAIQLKTRKIDWPILSSVLCRPS